MWDLIGTLVADGTTVLLTTQYLEEADQLTDRIVVVNHGRVIAEGTSDQLKDRLRGERLEISVAAGSDLDAAIHALSRYSSGQLSVDHERRHVVVPVLQGAQILAAVIRDLDAASVMVDDLALRRPTLDEVFLTLTEHHADEPDEAGINAAGDAQR